MMLNNTKGIEQIFTVYLELHPKINKGDLVVVTEYIDEAIYTKILPNLNTATSKGKTELGFTSDDGIALRIAAANSNALSDSINAILALAKDIIMNGVSVSSKHTVKPRKDLLEAFNNTNVLWDKSIPQVKALSIFSESHIFNYDESLKPLSPAGILVEKARLVPTGYKPELK